MNLHKTFSKVLVAAVSLCILLSNSVAFASVGESKTQFNSVKAKQELMQKADLQKSKRLFKKASTQEINKMLVRQVSYDQNSIKSTSSLEQYGIFKLDTPDEGSISIKSQGADVTMSTPSIYYDSNTREWVVVGGGYWNNDNWFWDIMPAVPNGWMGGYVGESHNLGQQDGFGVGYTSTNNSYTSQVNSVYSEVSDGNGISVPSTTRSDGDGSKGFGFRFQDYARHNTANLVIYPADTTYFGKHFGGLCRYSSSFSSYDGVATSYYLHTWKWAYINGAINFTGSSGGNAAGISFSIENSAESFPAYGYDTRF